MDPLERPYDPAQDARPLARLAADIGATLAPADDECAELLAAAKYALDYTRANGDAHDRLRAAIAKTQARRSTTPPAPPSSEDAAMVIGWMASALRAADECIRSGDMHGDANRVHEQIRSALAEADRFPKTNSALCALRLCADWLTRYRPMENNQKSDRARKALWAARAALDAAEGKDRRPC